MRRREKLVITAVILLLFFLLVVVKVPERIVAALGEEHAYTAVFLIAALGGVSTITAASYFGTIIAFASAGLNPWMLGLVGGIGVTIGDTLFFFFGNNSRVVLSKHVEIIIDKTMEKLERFNKWSVPIFVYLYAAFTPFPNEFMTVSVGISGAKYRMVGPALLLGNITITILTCFAVQYATTFF